MLSHVYQQLQSGQWADMNPRNCPCRNGGWFLSDLDTWHKCPHHKLPSMPHPEDEGRWDPALEPILEKEELDNLRGIFDAYRQIAKSHGFKGNFTRACAAIYDGTVPNPWEWVDAADLVAQRACKRARWERKATL